MRIYLRWGRGDAKTAKGVKLRCFPPLDENEATEESSYLLCRAVVFSPFRVVVGFGREFKRNCPRFDKRDARAPSPPNPPPPPPHTFNGTRQP